MSSATDRLAADSTRLLDDLVAELTDYFRTGDFDAIDRLLNEHPGQSERLRKLLPALVFMDALGDSSEAGRADPPSKGSDPTGGVGVLGDFRIVREVGRGGMGVVYEAVQLSLGRRVALKVLPFAAALDPLCLARFRVEAQAAALLQHAHIVPVHAVGCDRGVHYYAMQFIEGRTLADLITELRRASARPKGSDATGSMPSPTPSPSQGRRIETHRAAARLGLQAAEALDHAHSLGVIHRDVKPANLLLDTAGNLWVADFGLARLSNDAGPTRSEQVVGTLRYMTPEQALGRRAEADGRSDVYALGVTLYELFTLRPAFDGKDRRAVLRQVAFDEPKPPRSIDSTIPRDLETVVLKAMAKEPKSRYPTARELAEDLRQFLDDRPIRARRPSPIGLLGRWVKRYRVPVSTAVVTLAVAGFASTLLLWRENVRTRAALLVARAARENERDALRLTFVGSDLVASRALQKIAAASGPIDPADLEFCRRALEHYEQVCTRDFSDTSMLPLVAAAEHRSGFLRRILGMDGAERRLSRAVVLYEGEVGRRPDDLDPRKALSSALDDLAGVIALNQGESAAEPSRKRVVEVRRELVRRFPDVSDHRLSLALTLAYRIGPLLDLGLIREAESIRDELAKSSDEDFGLSANDHEHRNQIAWLLANRVGGAARAYRRAVDLARKATEIVPADRRVWNTLGVALYRVGDDREAERAFGRSMQVRDGGDPYDWLFLAISRRRLGDSDSARDLFDRSIAWISARSLKEAELDRFRREAAAIFGR